MRSIKGIIIGFLLILLGFAVTSYSLIAGGVLAAAGLAAVVIFALPKKTQQPQAEQPPAPAPEPEDLAPELRPEALPDILTDPPAQKKARAASRGRRADTVRDAGRGLYPHRRADLPRPGVDARAGHPPVPRVL